MTYLEQYAIQRSEALIQRFTVAVQQYSLAIIQELPSTPNHANRITWAKKTVMTFDAARDYGYRTLRLAVVWKDDTVNWVTVTDAEIQTMAETIIDRMIAEGI